MATGLILNLPDNAFKVYDKVPIMGFKGGAKTKAYIKNLKTGEILPFLFNPESFDTSRSVTYQEISSPSSAYPKYQFVKGDGKDVSVSIFLYSVKGECEKAINFLEAFLPTENSNARNSKPPYLLFAYGIFIKKCILLKIGRKHTLFTDSLGYKAVTVDLEMKVIA